MNLDKLIPDRDALEMARAAFAALAKGGASYAVVRAVLLRDGMRSATARRFIERMELDTKTKLPGDRPAARTVGQNKRLATIIHNAESLKAAKRAPGQAGRYAACAGGKTYANKTGAAGRLIFCESCGAPVVDTDAARLGHAARVGCAVV
jgi:hypothetical protein